MIIKKYKGKIVYKSDDPKYAHLLKTPFEGLNKNYKEIYDNVRKNEK